MEAEIDVQPKKKKADVLAIMSFAFGIGGLPVSIMSFFLALPLSILGLVFGILSLNSSKRKLAKAGIVTSVIGLIIFAAWAAVLIYVAIGMAFVD